MAIRPVFLPAPISGLVREEPIRFDWFPGFSSQQKQRSIEALHNSARAKLGIDRILEVSSKSPLELGRRLSAFNLKLNRGGSPIPVESAYQGSKVFRTTGPNPNLYYDHPIIARQHIREHTDPRELIAFNFFGTEWRCNYPTVASKTAFYDWLYLTALTQLVRSQPQTEDAIVAHDAFTDIEFNPAKSLATQARSCALYVTLRRRGVMNGYTLDRDDFLATLRGSRPKEHLLSSPSQQASVIDGTMEGRRSSLSRADPEISRSDARQLQSAIKARNIRRLCHFTPVESLRSIVTARYVLSQDFLLKSDPNAQINDCQRLDGHIGHVCTSIEYSNVSLLNVFKHRFLDRNVFWVILLVKPQVFCAEGVLFSPKNAARARGSDLRSGYSGFEAVFRREPAQRVGLAERVPTDIQAEVLIPDFIPLGSVYQIVAEKPREKDQVERELADAEIELPVIAEPRFFSLDAIEEGRSQSLDR